MTHKKISTHALQHHTCRGLTSGCDPVVPCLAARPKVVQRTLKFFLGILAKSWIVTVQWIKDCLFVGTLIEEVSAVL